MRVGARGNGVRQVGDGHLSRGLGRNADRPIAGAKVGIRKTGMAPAKLEVVGGLPTAKPQ